MDADSHETNPWEHLYHSYRAAALLEDRDRAFRQRRQLIRQGRALLGRAHRAHASWIRSALQDPERQEFVTAVLAANVPRSLLPAMIRAGVDASDAEAARRFIELCVRSFGDRAVNEALLPYLERGTPRERIGAALAVPWASVQEEYFWWTGRLYDREAQAAYAAWQPVRDKRTALLLEAYRATSDEAVRRRIVAELFLDPGVADEALRALDAAAWTLASGDGNRYVRWRATRLRQGFPTARAVAEARFYSDPLFSVISRAHQNVLRRCIRVLSAGGIDQFIDLDSTLYPNGDIHEVAQALNPRARVVYVESDPILHQLRRGMLKGRPLATAVRADVFQPAAVLAHDAVRHVVDLTRPVALLLLNTLPFLDDDGRAQQVVHDYALALTGGSYLALSHCTPGLAEGWGGICRSPAAIAALVAPVDLIEPGLVPAPRWRPEAGSARDYLIQGAEPESYHLLVGVGQTA